LLKRHLAPWLLALALAGAPARAEPYQNPVIPFTGSEVADPYVLKYNGEYYLYTSGDPILAFHSRDLVHWRKLGPVLSSTPRAWNEADLWAPEVVYRDGKFLMYYTATRKSADWRVGEMQRRVGVAVSDFPEGPFVDSGHPVTPTWAIDGHVYTDAQGQDWLFYSFLQEPEHPGAGIAVDRLVAYDKVAGAPTVCLQGSEAWEDKDGDPNNGSLRYTNEGPTVIERDGTLYLFYSGGSWDRPTYAVGYATASQPQGPWKKVAPPLLRATPLVDGPGHDALTRAPNGLDDVHLYHARTQPYLDPWNRMPFVDRLFWDGGRPVVDQPSLALHSPPEMPGFRDLFDQAGKPGAGWGASSGGTFEVKGGTLRASGSQALLPLAQPPDGPYLLEVNVALQHDSRAGVSLAGEEGQTPRVVVLDGQNRVLRTGDRVLAGFPKSFNANAFHQLILVDDGATVSVLLDGVRRGELSGASGSSPSLWIESGAADFDGVALSSGFHERFDSGAASAGWQGQGGTFAPSPAGWLQSSQDLAWRVKGPLRSRYEFSATIFPRDTSAPLVAQAGPTDAKWWAGVVAGRTADQTLLLAGFDKGIWPFSRFRVWMVQGGQAGRALEVGLPRGFRYDVPHTVRVVRDGDAWTVFLDERETLAARLALGDAQPGLFTQGVAATFREASYKQLVVEQNLLLNASFETEQWDGNAPAAGNPWVLSGQVRPNESLAHTGVRRLLFQAGQGQAAQTLALLPGKYRLHVFVLGRDARLGLSAGSLSRAISVSPGWSKATFDFEVATPAETTIALKAEVAGGGWMALDDVWLEARR
jgi:GH43 family beta-xylosidase